MRRIFIKILGINIDIERRVAISVHYRGDSGGCITIRIEKFVRDRPAGLQNPEIVTHTICQNIERLARDEIFALLQSDILHGERPRKRRRITRVLDSEH